MAKTNLPPQEENKPEAFTEHSYSNHPDWKWSQRIINTFCWGGMLVSALIIFLVLNVDSVRTLVSQPSVREFLLHYFPDAQLWVNATLKYKQEIVFLYVYRLFLWGVFGCIIFYFYVLNWNRMLVVHDLGFAQMQGKKRQMCKNKFKFILGLLLLSVIGYGFFMMFQGAITPMVYGNYTHGSSAISIGTYRTWNSYVGLMFVFIASVHLGTVLAYALLRAVLEIIMCFYKKNRAENNRIL